MRHQAPEGMVAVSDNGPDLKHLGRFATSMVANRRDVLRTAAGLAAAAVFGGAIADRGRAAVAAGTDGRSTVEINGLGQFDVLSFSYTISGSTRVGGGMGSGKVNIEDLMFTKVIDAFSDDLFLAAATGERFRRAGLTVADATGTVTLTAEMKQVLVSAVILDGSGTGTLPTESVTLTFANGKLSDGGK